MATPDNFERFTLNITCGNDAMQTRYDLVDALQQVILRLSKDDALSAPIRDANGNRVGYWCLEPNRDL